MDPYCLENYNCTSKTYFSESGCYNFVASQFTPNCHLFCETDACKYEYNPEPSVCITYICERLPNNLTTTSPPTPSPIQPATPLIPVVPLDPACPVCDNNIWVHAGIIIGTTVSVILVCIALPIIVGLWRRTQRPRRRRNDVESPDQNTFLLAQRSSSLSSQRRTSQNPIALENANFAIASPSNSPTPRSTEAVLSISTDDEPAILPNVFLDILDPITQATPEVVSFIPYFIPKLKSQECCSNDQMLAALLLQRCQLLLWIAQRTENKAVRYYKLILLSFAFSV